MGNYTIKYLEFSETVLFHTVKHNYFFFGNYKNQLRVKSQIIKKIVSYKTNPGNIKNI